MTSPIEAFKTLPPPIKFGVIGVGAAGAYVFIKKWKAAKTASANANNSPNSLNYTGNAPLPGWDNGGQGGGMGDAITSTSSMAPLTKDVADLRAQLKQLQASQMSSADTLKASTPKFRDPLPAPSVYGPSQGYGTPYRDAQGVSIDPYAGGGAPALPTPAPVPSTAIASSPGSNVYANTGFINYLTPNGQNIAVDPNHDTIIQGAPGSPVSSSFYWS